MPYEALDEVVYTTGATAQGGRDGHVKSEDGVVDVVLGKPGSKTNPKANPETLFAAGYAACFSGALNAVASRAGHDTSDSTVTASVSLGKVGEGFGLAVKLVAHIPGVDDATAQQLVEQAHQFCPYSKATRGNIDVSVSVA
ncbi:organic hydroperoxide resistance protein [Allobranchiibius sp. CTAmp26]|uniref:organic hydroperoxide resistance protein n=1 Tax=Allobranchiibius sp. CTAmp26 TaxID=2815214 RepID=UPI001AA10F9B|nr:organic hydroperoxide resistance protein [Allobranchiibius sp. CTAmp26]MBO1755410.1 organic hydroperoxide resistance protein [Allobranchiibius sp. CTAmp26]